MRASLQELALRRGVGIMATRAGGGLVYRILTVGFLELRFACVMASEAEGNRCLHQEVFLLGAVRKVALQASLCRRRPVNHLLLEILLVVALSAGFISLRL